MRNDYDDSQENDTNSSKYSEPMNIETGERASFHSAYSPEENSDIDKQQSNLPENNDFMFLDLNNQQFSDKNTYEPPLKGPERGQYRDFPLVQPTYGNTYADKKNPYDFDKMFGGTGQKDVRSGAHQVREIANYEDIPLASSEIMIQPKLNVVQDDRFKKKNRFEFEKEDREAYQDFGQEMMYQQKELKRIEKVPVKESSGKRYEDEPSREEKKGKEKEIDVEAQKETLRQLREKAQREEQEREQERQREKLRRLEIEREQEKERAKEMMRQKELEKERLRELEREKEKQRQFEKQRELEEQRELELEREREREREREQARELERQKELEKERERQKEIEREKEREEERQRELEKQKELELEREREREKEIEMEKEKQRKREKEKQAEQRKLQEKQSSKNDFEEVKANDRKISVEDIQQQLSRTSSTEKSGKAKSIELYDNFVDEDTLYPLKKESGRISKTIETQTNDVEFPSGYVTGLQSDRVEINIPETKVIRDGLIYTYLVYKIVTKLKDDEDRQTEFTVYRRYSDFDWLFENITSKYHGYIIPVPPPKNILTAFNKEGVEFSETRKKELVVFLRKCMQHPFLRNTPELNIFLSDDRGFLDFKKKEQALNQNKKDSLALLTNISKMLQGATKGKPYHLREIDGPEGDLYNYDVTFSNLRKRLQSFSSQMLEHLQFQKKGTAALLSFTHQLESTLSRSKYSRLEKEFQKVTSVNISEIEDNAIKDLTDKVENQLKDITSNVDAVTSAIERRNELARELNDMHDIIEEKNLKFKKDFTNGEELEELKKEYERLKKRCQEASEILLRELKGHKERIDHDLGVLLKSMLNRKEQYFIEVYNLWSQTQEQ